MKRWTRRSLPAAVSEPCRQWIPHPQSSFQMGADPAEGLTTASWEIPTHSHPAKLLPDPWPSEIVSGSNWSAQHHLTLGVICYVAGDNRHTHAYLSDLTFRTFSPCLPLCSPAYCAWNTPKLFLTKALVPLVQILLPWVFSCWLFPVSKDLVCSDHSFRVNHLPITICHIALLFPIYNSIHH